MICLVLWWIYMYLFYVVGIGSLSILYPDGNYYSGFKTWRAKNHAVIKKNKRICLRYSPTILHGAIQYFCRCCSFLRRNGGRNKCVNNVE
jgi:hypothetical protein